MELQHLRYFLDVAKLESISRAAEKNHIAQPAMSRIVALLEKEFGVNLFDRVGRTICLNACGRILMQAAEQSLSILDSVGEKIDYCNGHLTGTVRLCMHAPVWDFSQLTHDFRSVYPLVELDAQKTAEEGPLKFSPDYDLFLYMGPAKRDSNYDTCRLMTQEMVVVVHRDNPLAQRSYVPLECLVGQEIVVPHFLPLREMLFSYCYQAGFVPTIIGEASLPIGQRNLMDPMPQRRATVLLAQDEILPYWSQEYCVLPIREPVCGVDISMAWNRTNVLRPSVEAFRDYAIHFYQEREAGIKAEG